jgi:small subunit ribosomal protein S1
METEPPHDVAAPTHDSTPAGAPDEAGARAGETGGSPEPNGAGTAGVQEEVAGARAEPARKDREAASPRKGRRVTGTIVRITADGVFVDFGGREEGVLDPREIQDESGAATKQVGEKIQATVTAIDGGVRLSIKARARKPGNLPALREAASAGLAVGGKIVGVNKGGLVVYAMGVRAFCPFSQIDRRYVENPESFIGKKLQFKIASMDEKGKNVVLSRRILLEEEAKQGAAKLRERLAVGMELPGTVARIRPFGAFVDVGGLDGLVHVSEITHRRIKEPGEVLRVGQEVRVQVVKIEDLDGPNERISLSMKRLEPDPWGELVAKLTEGQKIRGKVVRLVDFGAFVEVAPGIDGLAHVSTLAEGRVEHPSDVLRRGDEVDAWIVSIDRDARRISLALVDPSTRPPRGGGKPARSREPRAPRPPRDEPRASAGTPGMTSMEEAFQRMREQRDND